MCKTLNSALVLTALGLACAGIPGCGGAPPDRGGAAVPERPSSPPPPAEADRRWASPVRMSGLENCYKVSDSLYRGAQPGAEGVKSLAALGIKTIVNLRSYHSDADEIGSEQIGYEEIPMKAWGVKLEHAVRFLQVVTDPARTPVFVHCQHGSDRTGTMIAVYRMAVQGWTPEEAIREMKEGGYGYHAVWRGLPEFLKDLDIDYVRRSAGIPAALRKEGRGAAD